MNTNTPALRPTVNPQPARPVPLDLIQLRHVAGGVKAPAAAGAVMLAPRGSW